MFNKIVGLTVAVLSLAVASNGFMCMWEHENLRDCCPLLPTVASPASLKACRAAKPPTWNKEKNISCIVECAFERDGFIITDANGTKTVNLTAVNRRLDSLAVGPWARAVNAAKANCTASPPVASANDTCTSGSAEVAMCLHRVMAANCPTPILSVLCRNRPTVILRNLVRDYAEILRFPFFRG